MWDGNCSDVRVFNYRVTNVSNDDVYRIVYRLFESIIQEMIYCKNCLSNIRCIVIETTQRCYEVKNTHEGTKKSKTTVSEFDTYYECECHKYEEDVEWWNKNGSEDIV